MHRGTDGFRALTDQGSRGPWRSRPRDGEPDIRLDTATHIAVTAIATGHGRSSSITADTALLNGASGFE